jgi:hypothetical protein
LIAWRAWACSGVCITVLLAAMLACLSAVMVTVPADLTVSPDDRGEVRARLRRVLLADGTRTLRGRWNEALAHIEAHRGVGKRMLDGRQVAVLAAGDTEQAAALLKDTMPGEDGSRPSPRV